MIFLTIGGNDLQFADIVKKCLVQVSRDGADCGHNLERAERMLDDGTLESGITSVLSGIHTRAHPDAKIVLLGYPYLETDTAYRLRSGHFGSTFIEVGQRLHDVQIDGDELQQRVVDKLNTQFSTDQFVFVKAKSTFAGHELSVHGSNPDRWFVEPWRDAVLNGTSGGTTRIAVGTPLKPPSSLPTRGCRRPTCTPTRRTSRTTWM